MVLIFAKLIHHFFILFKTPRTHVKFPWMVKKCSTGSVNCCRNCVYIQYVIEVDLKHKVWETLQLMRLFWFTWIMFPSYKLLVRRVEKYEQKRRVCKRLSSVVRTSLPLYLSQTIYCHHQQTNKRLLGGNHEAGDGGLSQSQFNLPLARSFVPQIASLCTCQAFTPPSMLSFQSACNWISGGD